nr:uncharacterized protein LOC129528598 isoform X2 [Gorilla gorilla gorilla]
MYFFMLLLFGILLLYREVIMGQWLHVDNIRVWKQLVPWLCSMSYARILVNEGSSPRPSPISLCGLQVSAHRVHPQVCVSVSLYNSTIISWNFFYSFAHPLPWDHCPLVKNISVTDWAHQYFLYHTTLHASDHSEEAAEALVLNRSLGRLLSRDHRDLDFNAESSSRNSIVLLLGHLDTVHISTPDREAPADAHLCLPLLRHPPLPLPGRCGHEPQTYDHHRAIKKRNAARHSGSRL